MIKMIVVDLDGTLLNDDGNISPYTISILKKCKEAGIMIIIATGRSLLSAKRIIGLIKPNFSILNYGALIVNEYNEVIYSKLLSLEELNEVNYEYLLNMNIDKIDAIEMIAKEKNISLSEIAVFGDSPNDIKMIKNCGTGIAMENAIQEVKNCSKDICGNNNEDGVAKWIEKNIFQSIAT